MLSNKTIQSNAINFFTVHAESTAMSSDNVNYCQVQSPKGSVNQTIQTVVSSVTSPIIDFSSTISQWQGVGLSYVALLNESTTLPNWIIVDNTIPSVVIKPNLFQTTNDISDYSVIIWI